MKAWQARIFGRPLGPPRASRAEALEDLVATGHASKDDYAPFRVWPIVPAEVAEVAELPERSPSGEAVNSR